MKRAKHSVLPPITADRLRELLHYDPATGFFTWKKEPSSKTKIGARAGSANSAGYGQIGLDGRMYRSNRLAVLYMTGQWPAGVVDHRNGDIRNDSWGNLRDVPSHVNQQNMRRARVDNSTGFLGVIRSGKRFMARIKDSGRLVNLGSFETPQEAHEVYLAEKRIRHAGCTI